MGLSVSETLDNGNNNQYIKILKIPVDSRRQVENLLAHVRPKSSSNSDFRSDTWVPYTLLQLANSLLQSHRTYYSQGGRVGLLSTLSYSTPIFNNTWV